MQFDIASLGTEVAVVLLGALAAILTMVAKRIAASDKPGSASVDEPAIIVRRIEQHERQIVQVVTSLGETLSRQHREKEIEDRRQFDRLHDKMDRLHGHHD